MTFWVIIIVIALWLLLYCYIVAARWVVKTKKWSETFYFIKPTALDLPGLLQRLVEVCLCSRVL